MHRRTTARDHRVSRCGEVMATTEQLRIAAETIVVRFPHARDEVQAVLVGMLLNEPPIDEDEDQTPCPRCGMWHLADGLQVPICPCGYCAHVARTGDKCDFCGVSK